jgi:hypothetical protein
MREGPGQLGEAERRSLVQVMNVANAFGQGTEENKTQMAGAPAAAQLKRIA